MSCYELHSEAGQTRSVHSPTVSVIIPCYASANLIGRTIDSVLAQTFTDYEIIIINDGSPDTRQLEEALSPYLQRITYIKQPNTGPAGARNAGIKIATGHYLAFLDSDDYWLPEYLREQLNFLASHRTIDLVYADALIVGDSPLVGQTFMGATPSTGDVTCENLLAEKCTIILSGTVVRRSSVLMAGLFDEQFHYAEDFDLWVRLLKQDCCFVYQTKVLLCRHEHAESLCSNSVRLFQNALSVIEKIKDRSDLTAGEDQALRLREAKLRANINLEQAKREFSARQFNLAANQLREANRFFRSWKLYCAIACLRLFPALLLRAYNSLRRPPGNAGIQTA